MAEEPENLTMRILQEMREEIRARMDTLDDKVTGFDERFTESYAARRRE